MSDKLVSVRVITYNHVKYIEKCIKGIINQKTDFNVEVCIGDDGSNDGTTEICRRFAEKYSNIKLYVWDRNDQERKKFKIIWGYNWLNTLKKCNGIYIALCDGDDYWDDEYKLQKQVELLEKNKTLSFTYHNTWDLKDGVKSLKYSSEKKPPQLIDYRDVLKMNYPRTVSLVFRSSALTDEFLMNKFLFDWILVYHLAMNGYGYYFDEPMAVYRIHHKGKWTSSNHKLKIIFAKRFYVYALQNSKVNIKIYALYKLSRLSLYDFKLKISNFIRIIF